MGLANRLDRLAVAASQKSKERDYWLTPYPENTTRAAFLATMCAEPECRRMKLRFASRRS